MRASYIRQKERQQNKKASKEKQVTSVRQNAIRFVLQNMFDRKPNTRMFRMNLKETKELVLWVASLANVMGEALEDGKISFTELPKFYGPLMNAGKAINGLKELPAELKAVTAEELSMLVEEVKEELDLPQDKVEMIVEKALELGIVLFTIVKSFKK